MTAHYSSKHGQVAKRPEELYMAFTDLRNFAQMVPADKVQAEIEADFDTLSVTVQGFRIGVRVDDREPYRLIRLGSTDDPVEFAGVLHLEPSALDGRTGFRRLLPSPLRRNRSIVSGTDSRQTSRNCPGRSSNPRGRGGRA